MICTFITTGIVPSAIHLANTSTALEHSVQWRHRPPHCSWVSHTIWSSCAASVTILRPQLANVFGDPCLPDAFPWDAIKRSPQYQQIDGTGVALVSRSGVACSSVKPDINQPDTAYGTVCGPIEDTVERLIKNLVRLHPDRAKYRTMHNEYKARSCQ